MNADKSQYFTIRNAEKFEIDWKGFYDRIDDLTAAVREELPHRLDLSYGLHPKQKLDLYFPRERPSHPAPVFIFLHGGGFLEGDRAHYGYVAGPLARRGVITAVPSYRLAPQHHFPDQPRDVRAVVDWIHQNIAGLGGDAFGLFIGGHSAGAILSADLAVRAGDRDQPSLPGHLIRGCLLVSGPFYASDAAIAAYLANPADDEKASPMLNIERVPPRAILAYGSREERFFEQNQGFAEKLRSRGCQVILLKLEGMDHDDTALALHNESSLPVQALLEMIGVNR